MICKLCPRECGVYKDESAGGGFCGASLTARVARIAPHMWEEPCLSGQRGTGAVFFSGCTMRCVYCQNYEISALNSGRDIAPTELADSYKRLESEGVHSISLITPTHYLPAVIRSLDIYRPSVPIVYNCGGYESVQTLKSLEDYIDIYLPDFKYSDDELALKLSGVSGYTAAATAAISEMLRQKGSLVLDETGIARSGVLVRHLILPGHTKNSIGVLDIIKDNFGTQAQISLMGQYVPHGRADEFPELMRKITPREYEKVLNRLLELELDGFAQELKSADESYIPDWDYNSN